MLRISYVSSGSGAAMPWAVALAQRWLAGLWTGGWRSAPRALLSAASWGVVVGL